MSFQQPREGDCDNDSHPTCGQLALGFRSNVRESECIQQPVSLPARPLSGASSTFWPRNYNDNGYDKYRQQPQEQIVTPVEPVPRRMQDNTAFYQKRFPIPLITVNPTMAMKLQDPPANKNPIDGSKLCPTRPGTAWRNFSYTDLITLAILSSSKMKMTVKDIYAWIAMNIPTFNAKKYEPAANGWKNTIRHTLSIRKRFVRIPTNTERRSLWTINPESLDSVVAETNQKLSLQPEYKRPADDPHMSSCPGPFLPLEGILIPRPSSFHE